MRGIKEYTVKLRGNRERQKVVAQNVDFGEHFVVFVDARKIPVASYSSRAVLHVRRSDAEGGGKST